MLCYMRCQQQSHIEGILCSSNMNILGHDHYIDCVHVRCALISQARRRKPQILMVSSTAE